MPERSTPAFPPDYHTHNELCGHAEGRPLDYARAAAEAGATHIAATDHCPTDDGYGAEHRMALEELPRYIDWVAHAQAESPIPVLLGIEADYYRGCERFLSMCIERYEFDIVLGSVHFLNYWGHPVEPRGLFDRRDIAVIWSLYFQRVGELADTGLYDVVAHLDLPKRFGPIPPEAQLREWALPALDRIASAGMAIEINTAGLRHSVQECYPTLPLLRWAFERGVGLTFGSDAHLPMRVADGFDVALRLAREAGYTTSRHYARRAFVEVPLPAPCGQEAPMPPRR
jgi:histidinol-phosphatase (PHP family)